MWHAVQDLDTGSASTRVSPPFSFSLFARGTLSAREFGQREVGYWMRSALIALGTVNLVASSSGL
jgi:hypothetical protein